MPADPRPEVVEAAREFVERAVALCKDNYLGGMTSEADRPRLAAFHFGMEVLGRVLSEGDEAGRCSLALWAASLVDAENERCIAACERIREAERNVGEDCPSGGWGGYKLGARDCASAIRSLRRPAPPREG